MKDNKCPYFGVIISIEFVSDIFDSSMFIHDREKLEYFRQEPGFLSQRAHAVKLIVSNRGGIGPRARNIESGFRIPETRDFGSYGMCYSSHAGLSVK